MGPGTILTKVDLLVMPYDAAASGQSVVQELIDELKSPIDELKSPKWTEFLAAVAFVKNSGIFEELLDSLAAFAERGGTIELTFGADTFAGDAKGSDYEAVKAILECLRPFSNAKVHLYHEPGARTFHPKIYLFSNEQKEEALAIIGSSNWSDGGFAQNIEANVVIAFDLNSEDHRDAFKRLKKLFEIFWSQR